MDAGRFCFIKTGSKVGDISQVSSLRTGKSSVEFRLMRRAKKSSKTRSNELATTSKRTNELKVKALNWHFKPT